MKFFAALVSALCLSLGAGGKAPVKATDVANSIGVNTHWEYGAPYAYLPNFTALIGKLQQAGIWHFRDSQWSAKGYDTSAWVTSMYRQLNAAGLKADIVVTGQNPALTCSQLTGDLQKYPGMELLEFPNEYDYNGGSKWVAHAQTLLPQIWCAGNNAGVPVIGPAFVSGWSFGDLGNVSRYMNYGNVHDYQGNRNPEAIGWGGGWDSDGHEYGSILWNVDMAHEYAPGKPVIATETGIQTTTGTASGKVPEAVQGTYAPRVYLAAFERGLPRTYYYELVDTPYSDTYGLLHRDLTPKPAYRAIQNLQSILGDVSGDFTPKALTYTLSGNTANIESLLVQKRGGVYWLFLWNNQSIWDVTNQVATPVANQNVTLTINGGMVVTYVAQFHSDGTVGKSWPQYAPLHRFGRVVYCGTFVRQEDGAIIQGPLVSYGGTGVGDRARPFPPQSRRRSLVWQRH